MLVELRIENFGIIDEMRLHPGAGLIALTGETGAGKSLIIQSLLAILGARLGAGVVRSGAPRACVEARFEVSPELQKLLAAPSDEVLLRREISVDGKSRVFINGAPGTLSTLKQAASLLLEMHGQHDQQKLLDADHQLDALDIYCSGGMLREQVGKLFSDFKTLSNRLRVVTMQKEERDFRLEFLHSAVKEIDRLSPVEGEFERLSMEKSLMQNGGKLFEDLHVASMLLSGEDGAILTGLSRIQALLEKHEAMVPDFSSSMNDLREACILLETFYEDMRRQMDRLQFSPERLEDVEERLQGYRRLFKRHNATDASLLRIRDDFLREIGELEGVEENEKKIRSLLAKSKSALLETAELLSRLRRSSIPGLEERVARELGALGMPGAELRVSVTRELESAEGSDFAVTEKGLDRVEFYFQPNPGEPAQPLRKIASGGELSRIMLAFKSVLMESRSMTTVVFDEVDAGVGGEVALTIAERLKALSRESQVLVVTHLPQVAAKALQHFRVQKRQESGRTVSRLARLGQETRVQEIARMMGGERAMDYARDCLAVAG